jgi:MraZ protein
VLRLYTERWFEAAALKREETLTPDQDAANLEATFFGNAEQLDVDANFRVRLPSLHLELTRLPREVVVIGAGNRLEVRSRDAWNATRDARFQDLRLQVAKHDARRGVQ